MAEPENAAMESLVVADFGRGLSRAFLLEQASGAFRFVAKAEGPTTAEPPFEDVSVGWRQLLRQLEWDAGRRLTERDELLLPQAERGDGVDGLLICATLGEPVRVALLVAQPESAANGVSGAVLDALKRTHARVFQVTPPNDRKNTGWAAAQAEVLRGFRPEVVILVGAAGDDQHGHRARLLQIIRQLGMSNGIARALVIADGAMHNQGLAAFSAKTKTRGFSPSSIPATDIAAEIERELTETYGARLETSNFAAISHDAEGGVVVRAHAVDLVNRFIARAFGRRVITVGIDDGTHVHWADESQGALATLPQLDLGPAITSLTGREVADAARWLPFKVTEDELTAWVLNRAIRPWTLPTDPRDLVIEQAMARQVARRGLAEIARTHPLALAGADLVVGGRWFSRWNQPGAAALALLDSVDVVPNHGVLDLALDQDGLMAVAGTVGIMSPPLASDVFEYDGLTHLGSAVVIGGPAQEGELACRGEIHYEAGDMASFSVASGTVEVLPLRPGETATLILRPERRFSVGGHPSGKAVTLSDERRIIGGAVGVIIDTRGRSLGAGPTPSRHAKVKQWLDVVNGVIAPSIRRN